MYVDVPLLGRHKAPPADLVIEPGCVTNWLGIRTDTTLFSHGNSVRDRAIPDLPTGGDGVYGSYCAYASFLTAIEHAAPRRKFNAIELGAGWGPWVSAMAVVCRRLGFDEVNLVAVEADEGWCGLMREHFARNQVSARIMRGAAWKTDTTVHFPVIDDPRVEHAAAATAGDVPIDYRGKACRTVEVPGLSLRTIGAGLPVIDYVHCDVSGGELDLVRSDPEFFNTRVRYLYVTTRSRPIEGGLIEFFFAHQWDVLHEQPCRFEYDCSKPSIEGMCVDGGELFARNSRLT